MRGILEMIFSLGIMLRITPACAGNTGSYYNGSHRLKDHPRVCGEYRYPDGSCTKVQGYDPNALLKRWKEIEHGDMLHGQESKGSDTSASAPDVPESNVVEPSNAFEGIQPASVANHNNGYNRMKPYNDIAKELWGRNSIFGDDFADLDEQTRAEIISTLDKMMQEYPQLYGQISSVEISRLENAFAGASKGSSGSVLIFDKKNFANRDKLLWKLAKNDGLVKDIESLVIHESGHLLESLLQTSEQWQKPASAKKVSSQIVKEALENLGYETVWDPRRVRMEIAGGDSGPLRKEISKYAAYYSDTRGYNNDGELIAESFTYVWYNGSGQNKLADAVVDVLLRRLEQ